VTGPPDQQTIDQTVLRVVHNKAARLAGTNGFSRSDREDIQQELLVDYFVRVRKFDPAKSSCRTFLYRVVRHRIASLLDAQHAACRNHRLCRDSLDGPAQVVTGEAIPLGDFVSFDECEFRIGRHALSSGERQDLRIDVDRVIATLPYELAAIADLLRSVGVVETANQLGVPRSTVYRRITAIRAVFARAGLDLYVRRPGTASARPVGGAWSSPSVNECAD
jgi:RNA polymerase sigma-70 factor (ECF subfamily)